MVSTIALIVVAAAASAVGLAHHRRRARRTLAEPSGLHAASADAWVGGLTGIAWLVAVGLVLGLAPAASRPVGAEAAVLLVTTGIAAVYAAKLLPYALARPIAADDVQQELSGLGAEAVELVVSAHRARRQPAVARTTLVAVVPTGARAARFPLAWAERAVGGTLAACVDPEVRRVATASGLPIRVVRDDRALAPLLGAPLPP